MASQRRVHSTRGNSASGSSAEHAAQLREEEEEDGRIANDLALAQEIVATQQAAQVAAAAQQAAQVAADADIVLNDANQEPILAAAVNRQQAF
jgi:hypothetical protein